MLRYFRINDPYRLIILLILLILTGLPLLIDLPDMTLQELKDMVVGEEIGHKLLYVEIIDATPPMMAAVDGALDFIFGRSLLARHIFALFIIFFQAAYFGILLINNKAYNESNYVPALVFGLLCFFSFDLLAVSPELLASTMLLLALNNLFKEIEFRVDRDSIVLNLGVFIGIASMFAFSYTVFLFGAIFLMIVFARASFRKISLMLFGYGLVHAILITVYYCYEQTGELWTNFYVANLNHLSVSLMGMNSIFFLGALPVTYFVFSLFMLTRAARFTRYQAQLFQAIFLWLAIAILQVWLAPERTAHSFFPFIPPFAYFISHYLLLINRKWIAEIMLWIFMMGLLAVNYLSYYHILRRVDYSTLFPVSSPYEKMATNKKVMILGHDPSLYLHNRLSGYFLDWELSKAYFEQPDYFEHITKINRALTLDPPDMIIDERGLIPKIAERIPLFDNKYIKEKEIYRKR